MKRRKQAPLEPQLPGYLTLEADCFGVSPVCSRSYCALVQTQLIAGFVHEHARAACTSLYTARIVHLMMRPLTATATAMCNRGLCICRPHPCIYEYDI